MQWLRRDEMSDLVAIRFDRYMDMIGLFFQHIIAGGYLDDVYRDLNNG